MNALDRRIHAWRDDLAASVLRGRVEAPRFVEGEERRIIAASVPLRREPRPDRAIDTELLFGEDVMLYDQTPDGWAWVQNATDGYVGWLPASALTPAPADRLGVLHPGEIRRVRVLRSFRYPGPDLKFPALDCLSMEARVEVTGSVTTRGKAYARLGDGSFMIEDHLSDPAGTVADWVAVAESFLGTPYLWGGRTSLGLDCSALVQLALAAGGVPAPRDSDMQEAELGHALDIAAGLPDLRRGDLMFWKGHVAIVTDPETLLHANGHTMTVAREPVAEALERIGETEFGALTSLRRLGS